MKILIQKSNLEAIKERLIKNINDYISYLDSFLEDHILNSQHYEILLDSKQIGYFSLYEKSILTQFYLDKEYRFLGQEVFDKTRRYEEVQKALVSTSDEFFLSHIIDYTRKIECQAYFFKDSKKEISKDKILNNFSCRLATEEDIDFIKEKTGDFFNNLTKQVKENQIYICYLNELVVSFGVIEKSKLYENVASIGMFTLPEKRQRGIGRNTLTSLKEICYKNNIIPIAGCWYYNHNSKKTLESSGMYSQTRLLIAHF